MKLNKRFLLGLLVFCLFLGGCSPFSVPTNTNAAFQNFTLHLFQQDISSTTLGLHYTLQNPEDYGISDFPITFGSFDTDKTLTLASLENLKTALNKFSYQTLSSENQLTYDILSSYINTAKTGVSYMLFDEPLSPLTGIHAQLPVLLAEYQFYTSKDAEIYLQLLETLPDYFASLIRFEEKKSNAGLFMSDASTEEIISQCNAFLAMGEENYLFSSFEERLAHLKDLTTSEKNTLIIQNQQVITDSVLPAYEELVYALQSLKGSGKNELGLCYYPEGKDYFSYLVTKESGTFRTIQDLNTLMETQMCQDLLEIQKLVTQNPDLIESASTIISSTPELLLNDLKSKITSTFPTIKPVNVEIKYVPDSLEPYLSPAFYLIPSIDASQENVIYINESHSLEGIQLFTTLAHEGYPGHLYQTTYFSSMGSDPVRSLFSFKGYVEGWATYAEMCSYYLSDLEKDAASLLQKNNSFILGLYAKADMGIHYYGWNLDRTTEFFKQYGITDENTIREIFQLIIADPANYLSYYVGYLEILELKREMIEEKGADFSQKEFHKNLLDIGPAPFEVVHKVMFRD